MLSVPPARRPRAAARALTLTGAALAVTLGGAARASAQVQLSGASMFQIQPSDKQFVPVNSDGWVSTNPAAGLFGSSNAQVFLGTNGLGSLQSNPFAPLTLNAGVNTVTFASSAFYNFTVRTGLPLALSLFFGSGATAPGLTGYNVAGAAGSAVQGAPGAVGYNPFTGAVAGAANSAFLTPDAGLISTVGGFTVALTNFQFAATSIKYVQPGSVNPTPQDCGGAACNLIGTFQVTVTPLAGPTTAPEPATYALFVTGLAGVGLVARRRRAPADA